MGGWESMLCADLPGEAAGTVGEAGERPWAQGRGSQGKVTSLPPSLCEAIVMPILSLTLSCIYVFCQCLRISLPPKLFCSKKRWLMGTVRSL